MIVSAIKEHVNLAGRFYSKLAKRCSALRAFLQIPLHKQHVVARPWGEPNMVACLSLGICSARQSLHCIHGTRQKRVYRGTSSIQNIRTPLPLLSSHPSHQTTLTSDSHLTPRLQCYSHQLPHLSLYCPNYPITQTTRIPRDSCKYGELIHCIHLPHQPRRRNTSAQPSTDLGWLAAQDTFCPRICPSD